MSIRDYARLPKRALELPGKAQWSCFAMMLLDQAFELPEPSRHNVAEKKVCSGIDWVLPPPVTVYVRGPIVKAYIMITLLYNYYPTVTEGGQYPRYR